MYATLRLYTLDETFDKPDVTREVRDVLLPKLRQVPGFVDYFRFEAVDGTIITFGIYRDKQSAHLASEIVGRFNKSIHSDVVMTNIYEGPIDVQSREALPL